MPLPSTAEQAPAEAAPAETPPPVDEDALFGGTSADTGNGAVPDIAPAADSATGGGEQDLGLGALPVLSDQSMAERLAAAGERLTIGGRLYLRQDAYLTDTLDTADAVDLAAPSPLDLFLDVRPNDRVRGYVRGRLTSDWTVPAGAVDPFTGEPRLRNATLLDQAWLKFDVARRAYVTVGRQRVKWGAGRFWNPTDFLNQQVLSPLEVFDLRTGVSLVRVHVPFEATGANLYAIANLEGADALSQVGGAVRGEIVLGHTELTASAAAREGQPLRLGADVSTGLGPFDLRLEGAVLHGEGLGRWTGSWDLATLATPEWEDRSEDWIPVVVAGGELSVKITGDDAITFGLEGMYNGNGATDARLLPWEFVSGTYVPLYAGQQYGAAYVFLPGPGRLDDHTFTCSAIANLSDGSAIARLDHRVVVLTHLTVNAYAAAHLGEEGELRLGIDIPPVPGVPGLESGIQRAPPRLDLGLGGAVSF